MLLVIDVGNTHLRLGTARDGVLAGTRRATTSPAATPDELELLLDGLLGLDGHRLADVAGIALASTVPSVSAALETVAARRTIACVAASAGTVPFPVRVERPGDVGPDRLVNAFAASHLYGTPAVVVDCGTATTLDAVDHAGAFVGGAIAPGMVLGLEALAARTARLPRVEPRLPGRPDRAGHASAIRARDGAGPPRHDRGPARPHAPRAGRCRRRGTRRRAGRPDRGARVRSPGRDQSTASTRSTPT